MCYRHCQNGNGLFLLFKQFLETELTNHCSSMHFQESVLSLMFQGALKVQRISPFCVCCLLCYSAIWLHITVIVYEFHALQYTHYQRVIVILDVVKRT